MQREVDAAEQHEQHQNHFNGGAVEIHNARIVGGKAAGRHRREAVKNGVERRHAREPEGGGTQHHEADVDIPQRLGGFLDARREFAVLHRARRFGLVKLHTAHTQHGQDGHRQYHDAHAAQKLQNPAPQIDRYGQLIQPDQHSGAGGGQTGHGFKVGVGKCCRIVREHERQRTEQGEQRPEQAHDHKAIAQAQLFFNGAHRQPQQQTADERNAVRPQKGLYRPVITEPGKQQRRQHGDAEQHQQQAHDALNDGELHKGSG